MKQIFFFLVITLVLLLPNDAFAQMGRGTQFTIDNITYQVVTNTNATKVASVLSIAATGDVVIPSSVESVTPERYLWTIRDASNVTYSNPTAIESITYEEGITSAQIYPTLSQVKTINIPSTVSKITTYVNVNCLNSIEALNISEDNPYFCCEDLVLYDKDKTTLVYYLNPTHRTNTSFSVPEGVQSMHKYAFASSQLLELRLPSSVNDIQTVYWGTKLENIFVNADNPTYCDIDGILFSEDHKTLYTCPVFHEFENGVYNIPEPVEVITYRAFSNTARITNVNFPNSIQHVENSAFTSCNNLGYVTLPDEGDIDESAFYSCVNIRTVDIGKRDSFSAGMFNNCSRISEIIVSEENETYCGKDGIIFTKDEEELVFCPRAYGDNHDKEYTIPQGTLRIGNNAFGDGCKLEKINIATTVESIGVRSFQGASNVEFLEPSNLTDIDSYAFYKYKGSEIVLPSSVRNLNGNVFYEAKLSSLTLNEGLETIGTTFLCNDNIEELVIPSTLKTIGKISQGSKNLKRVIFREGSKISEIGIQVFINMPALEEVIFEEGSQLTTISGSFANLTNLKTIVLPETVTTIYSNSFFQCENLESVTFREPCQLTTIGANTFQSCGLKSFDVPSSVKTISDAAFYDCNKLETIHLPAATTSCSNTAFMLCTGLKEINVDKENQYLASSDGILLDKKKEELKIFPAGKATEHFTLLPPSIKKIGDYSFYFNKSLKNVCIPNKVTSIGVRAFAECPNLETMTFLCDEMINPANIKIGDSNTASFALTPMENITIYVRKDLLSQYENTDFYKQFKQIKPSFLNAAETEEYIPVDASTVDLLDVRSHDFSYIVPNSVTHEGKTYDVKLIGDYAFQNASSDIKEVITFENVEYIGTKAFKQTAGQSIKNIIFVQKEPSRQLLSTYRFELTPADLPKGDAQYLEMDNSLQHIYVRRSDTPKCKEQWAYYSDVITYEIPTTGEFNIIPSAENGTFSREFAVDLSNNGGNTVDEGNRGLLAFVPGERFKISDTEYNIRMYSINEGGDGDGTYIPAGTGVLLRKYSGNVPSYYEIAENQSSAENPMTQSVVINSGTIPASTATTYNFYIGKSDGLAHKATRTTSIGVHRAYLTIPIDSDNSSSAKKVTFSFANSGITTDINEVMPAAVCNDLWYNVNGQRISNPVKGLYIRNGKKVAVK